MPHTAGRIATLLVALSSLVVRPTHADELDAKFAALPQSAEILTPGSIEKARAQGAFGHSEPSPVQGRDFSQAIRIRTDQRPAEPYQFQVRVPTTAAAKKGDKLLAIFTARAIAPQADDDAGETEFVFESAAAPYAKSVSRSVKFDRDWQKFYIPFAAKEDYAAGQAAAIFRAGFNPQTIEIAGARLLDFGPDISLEKLPATPNNYVGRAPSAPWRKAAAERIDRLRKADLTITVVDAAGKPMPGAKVRAQMKRSAFGWGTAVDANTLLGQGADNDRYRQILSENFNKAILENDMKWGAWTRDPQRALDAVAWLRQHGFAVRGHVLVWPGKTNLPKQVIDLLSQPDALRQTLLDHVTAEVSAFRGQLAEWDVVNEPYTNFDVQAALTGVTRGGAPDYIERHAATLVPFFQAARAADSAPRLDINDYSILETGGKDAAHQDHYERTIRALLTDGAPLQGIGIQGHFSEDLTPIPQLWKILDRFGKFGLPIQITEFDVNVSDEALQADYTRDFLTAMYAHENVSGVLIWGFWEGRHWIPNAAPYRKDWSLRPAGQAWLDLVQKQWRTDAEGVTDGNGQWKVRGFQGDYEITAQSGSKSADVNDKLPKDGAAVKLVVH